MIPTHRRIEYAMGYLALGMLRDAEKELSAVAPADRELPAMLSARIALHQEVDDWSAVENLARRLIELEGEDPGAWISLGCAVRRTKSIEAARDLLLAVEPRFGSTCATLHYNLACYHCLLGERTEAAVRLATACRMDANFKSAARSDPDLESMRDKLDNLEG